MPQHVHASSDEWTVIGAKGKPRRRGGANQLSQQPQCAANSPSTAAAEAAQPCINPHSLLPSWEAPSVSPRCQQGQQQQQPHHTSSRSSRPRSQEERLEHLCQQLDAMVQELSSAPVFQSLLGALEAVPSAAVAPLTSDNSRFSLLEPSDDTATTGQQQQQQHQEQQQPISHTSSNTCQADGHRQHVSVQAEVRDAERDTAASEEGSSCSNGSSGRGSWGWSAVQQLVVYGLGSCEHSKVSRYQLAMARLLQSLLPGLSTPPQLFDPAFTELDRALLQRLGMQVIPRDEGGARPVQVPTFFFLPHCEADLCERLLEANWAPQQLPLVTIWGNCFSTYQERWALRGTQHAQRPHRMLCLADKGLVCERAIPDRSFHIASAFNDMGLHTFPPDQLAAASLQL